MAKRFVFRLDPLLKLRKARQKDQQRVVADRMRQVHQSEHELAILLHHRGEVYQALGEHYRELGEMEEAAAETKKANRDLREAKKLGYNPAEGVW